MIAILTVVMVAEVESEEEAGSMAINADQAARISVVSTIEREGVGEDELYERFRVVGTQVAVVHDASLGDRA